MTLPNLELLLFRFEQYLASTKDRENKRYCRGITDIHVFPQTWPNTGGGFACKGAVYGQSMTKQYTTVILNAGEQSAIVFFGNDPAYWVSPLTENFWNDLHRCRMAGIEDAFARYDDKLEDETDGDNNPEPSTP